MTTLSFGSGEFDVMLDLARSSVVVYDGGEEFHSRYGGRQYYTSRSGRSGAGWIPSRLDRLAVRGYRTETETPWAATTPIGGGLEVGIPTNRTGSCGNLATDYPAVVRTSAGLVLCPTNDLFAALGGNTGTQCEYTLDYFQAPNSVRQTLRVNYGYVGRDWWAKQNRRNINAVLMALHREIFFRPDETPPSLPFWRRLGLHWQSDGCAYKIAQGVARKRYTAADLQTQEQLQDAAPANVMFLSPRHYVQLTRDGDYEAVGLSACGDYDYELAVAAHDAMRALMGASAEVMEELDRGVAAGMAARS